ncbi:MAG TPA: hypothetical protein VK038_12295 [Ornithinicoccus sp.]|jgi:hypothetical protein|nr:hypothetical protein [Ornithinicoccus sp.]
MQRYEEPGGPGRHHGADIQRDRRIGGVVVSGVLAGLLLLVAIPLLIVGAVVGSDLQVALLLAGGLLLALAVVCGVLTVMQARSEDLVEASRLGSWVHRITYYGFVAVAVVAVAVGVLARPDGSG